MELSDRTGNLHHNNNGSKPKTGSVETVKTEATGLNNYAAQQMGEDGPTLPFRDRQPPE